MDKFTLTIVSNLDYNQIMVRLLTPNGSSGRMFFGQISHIPILLIALSTGLPLKELIDLKWESILEYNSKGVPQCLKYFKLPRKYDLPISQKIQNQLIRFYSFLHQPNFKEPIAIKFKGYKNIENWQKVINSALGFHKMDAIKKNDWANYQNQYLTQIIFGRRVYEICGYSDKTNKFLKGIFEMNSNEEILDFLGYQSKSDINYNLSSISIIEGGEKRYQFGNPKSFLDDNKHFYNFIKNSEKHYPFQHFNVFYDYLQNLILYHYDLKTQSILILLMISLVNGIRPSSLLNLKWSDMFLAEKDRTLDKYILKKIFKFGRFQIILDPKTMRQVSEHFKQLHNYSGDFTDKHFSQLSFPSNAPSLDKYCFVTNRLNVLTQPSLNREIKNSLNIAGFQHTDKFSTKSTMIMYGRRIIELKGIHKPTLRALKRHFNIKATNKLLNFLYVDEYKGNKGSNIEEYDSITEHILYDI